jgi:hypothetical protein
MSQRKAKEIAFVEDIFIVSGSNNKPVVYRLREDTWKALPPLSEDDLHIPEVANLMPLIRNEVVLADVPSLPGHEAYLFVNLTALAVNKD